MRFKDKIVLITGGSRGIGRGIVEAFAREGASVVFTYKSSQSQAAELEKEVSKANGSAEGIQNNAVDTQSVAEVVDRVVDKYGKIDFLVNNAGITRDQLLLRMSEEDWDEVIANNLKSVYNFSKAVIRPMMGKRYGKIINVTSVVGLIGNPGQANYAASKAGIIGFTKALAKEVASRNINVNAVAPGFVLTDLTAKLNDDQKKSLQDHIPLKRLGTLADIAGVICFLCSEDASYITGQVICVDGGMVI